MASSFLLSSLIESENLFLAWEEYKKGKRNRREIWVAECHIEDFLFCIQKELSSLSYRHGPYSPFRICDPKERRINKATLRDRFVHHLIYTALDALYDSSFHFHSYSCRKGKGTHVAVKHLQRMIRKASANNTLPCYGLKMDIKRFFDSVNQCKLKALLRKKISDSAFLRIVDEIIDSFSTRLGPHGPVGLPLGNVTSQFFANLYLHELDVFIKHAFRKRFYLRYCDDFILLDRDPNNLIALIAPIEKFLEEQLHLELHPHKVSLRKLSQGIDFVGTIIFPYHTLIRTKTKQRIKKSFVTAFNR